MQIPFNRPYLTGNELLYIEDAINSAVRGEGHICGDGRYTHLAQEFMESRFSAERVLLTTSGTSAL